MRISFSLFCLLAQLRADAACAVPSSVPGDKTVMESAFHCRHFASSFAHDHLGSFFHFMQCFQLGLIPRVQQATNTRFTSHDHRNGRLRNTQQIATKVLSCFEVHKFNALNSMNLSLTLCFPLTLHYRGNATVPRRASRRCNAVKLPCFIQQDQCGVLCYVF